MKISNRRRMDDSANHNVWRSYSDMMSGLLLLFVLIMAVCLMQAQKNYMEKLAEQAKQLQTQSALEASQDKLEEQQEKLNAQQEELNAQQEKLDTQSTQLDTQEKTLAEQASALQELQDALENQRPMLVEKETEVDRKNALLEEQEGKLAASQTALDEANDLMQAQQERIDQIIGVKAELIEALDEEFRANQINVQIDTQTGAILLDSSVLFEFNESMLTDTGMNILDTVLPVYCGVLLNSEYSDYVAEIIIDGYTDTIGDYVTNLSLSQQRAYAVAEYLLYSMDRFLTGEEQTQIMQKLSANGKSMSNPVTDAQGNIDDDASRRVEIKFRLTDEEMLSELQQLVSDGREAARAAAQPETVPAEAGANDVYEEAAQPEAVQIYDEGAVAEG